MDQFDVEKLKDGAEKFKGGAQKALKEGKSFWDNLNSFFNFDNPGKKLKAFVKVLNKVNLALTLILFVVWFFVAIATEVLFYAFWLFLLGYVVIVLAYALSYLGCLFFFAFAEMVENSTTLVELKKQDKE